MFALPALFIFPSLMAYAAVSDLLTMTISNKVSLILLAAFVPVSLLSGMAPMDVLVGHLSCGAAVLCLTFGLFALGWIGGGDAKLAAATAVWLGWGSVYDYAVEASLFGAALTLAILALRRLPLPIVLRGQGWLTRLQAAGTGVPYGVALAAAGLMLYPETAVWGAAAAG